MKKYIFVLFVMYGCNGNSDADYVSGFRRIKHDLPIAISQYADSVNKESKKIDSLYNLKNKK